MSELLRIRHLSTSYVTDAGVARAVALLLDQEEERIGVAVVVRLLDELPGHLERHVADRPDDAAAGRVAQVMEPAEVPGLSRAA